LWFTVYTLKIIPSPAIGNWKKETQFIEVATKNIIHIHFPFFATLEWPLAEDERVSHRAKENYN